MDRKSENNLRIIGEEKPKKVCFIATEDSKRGAKRYFDELGKSSFCEDYIVVIPPKGTNTAPHLVLSNLKEIIREKGGLKEGDVAWIVCDIDLWEKIEATTQNCKKEGIKHAFSNPCFEIWILYHNACVKKNYRLEHERKASDKCKKDANQVATVDEYK